MADAQLFERYERNKQEGIRLIIESYKRPLYNYCYYLSNNRQEAEDLFQDVWVKVFAHLNRFDRNQKFANWLFAIATNTYRDRYRKAKRWLYLVKDYLHTDAKDEEMNRIPSASHLPEDHVLQEDRKSMLRTAIASLKDDYKFPLILYYYHDCSYLEISEILNIPEGTVKSRLSTAKKILKHRMEASWHE